MPYTDYIGLCPAITGIVSGLLAVIITFNPTQKMSEKRIWLIAFVVLAIIGLGTTIWQQSITSDKEVAHRAEEVQSKAKQDSLSNDVHSLVDARIADSNKNNIFLKDLRDKFGIVKDSVNDRAYYIKNQTIVNQPKGPISFDQR